MGTGASQGSNYYGNSACPVCTESNITQKLLSCQHTMCVNCIDAMLRTVRQQKRGTNTIACPLCRRSVKIPKGDPEALPTITVTGSQRPDTRNVMCEFCSNSGVYANKYCKDCDQNICSECAIGHCRREVFSDHLIIHTTVPACVKHIGKQCLFYCLTCHKALCATCVQNGVCEKHRIRRKNDLVIDSGIEINKVIDRLTECIGHNQAKHQPMKNMAKHLRESLNKEKEAVLKHRDYLISKIRKAAEDIVKKVEEREKRLAEVSEKLEADDYLEEWSSLKDAAIAAKDEGCIS